MYAIPSRVRCFATCRPTTSTRIRFRGEISVRNLVRRLNPNLDLFCCFHSCFHFPRETLSARYARHRAQSTSFAFLDRLSLPCQVRRSRHARPSTDDLRRRDFALAPSPPKIPNGLSPEQCASNLSVWPGLWVLSGLSVRPETAHGLRNSGQRLFGGLHRWTPFRRSTPRPTRHASRCPPFLPPSWKRPRWQRSVEPSSGHLSTCYPRSLSSLTNPCSPALWRNSAAPRIPPRQVRPRKSFSRLCLSPATS